MARMLASAIIGSIVAASSAAAGATDSAVSSSAQSVQLRTQESKPSFLRIHAPIVLDGRLDEPAWAAASPVSQFFEVYPANIAQPKVHTEARFLYDSRYVYVGIRASDPDPSQLRSHFTRRDQLLADQDYVEVMIDPHNSRQSAMFFRTNPQGSQTDGQFSEDSGTRNYLPDFDFDVSSTADASGWSAEFRIPLSTLRYAPGAQQSWTVVIYRNVPRELSTTIASVPAPRGSTCVLCYADPTPGISVEAAPSSFTVTPHITYSHREASNQVQTGVDAKWQMRPDTVVDFTVAPDFSQVEADALQLTANTRFALAVNEKRPFFLESADLLSTPITAIYTRAFADPDAGVRITHRSADSEYSALFLRDAGGGTVIEPGATSSSAVGQDVSSTAFVGRYRILQSTVSWGALGSVRLNDDGSNNAVAGLDANWAPSTSDRLTGQILWSQTRTPDRPDLLPAWDGRQMDGLAGYAGWRHNSDAWYSSLSYKTFSQGFRSWNGFLSRVGTSSAMLSSGLYFYPRSAVVTRISPYVYVSSTSRDGGGAISRSVSPGISIDGPLDTEVTFSWSPAYQDTTDVGLRSASSWSASVVSTPVEWMPSLVVSFSTGQTIDYTSGTVGHGRTIQASIPLRFNRFELDTSVGYQSLNADESAGGGRLLTERNVQVNAIWHFSSRLYVQGMIQSARTTTAGETGSSSSLSSFLLSYQSDWQTRYFIGLRDGSQGREVFAKFAYALSR